MKNKFFTVLLCLYSLTSMAQNITITGTVTDEGNVPIPGVSIVLENTSTGTATDFDGKYTLQVPQDGQALLFSAIGFRTIKKDISAQQNQVLNVRLQEEITQLTEATIKMERRLKVNKLNIKNLEAPMTTHTISAKLLDQMDITNIEDASKSIAGLHSVNRYGGFHFFNIRGFDNFVLLYDGIRDERHTITRSAPVANFANVERIEMLKGPSSTMFGHSALGGIVNIIRKKPTNELSGNFKFTAGSYDTYNMVAGVGGPLTDKIRYRFDAGIGKTDGWKDVKENTNNMSLHLDYRIDDRNKLDLYAQYNNDYYGPDTGVPGTPDGKPLAGINPETNFANPNDYLTNEKTEFQLKYTHFFNNGSTLTNNLSYYDDSMDYLMDEVLFYNTTTETFSRRNGPYHFNHITKPLSNQLDYTFYFDTGSLKHKSIAGTSFTYLDRETIYGDIVVGDSELDLPVDNFVNPGVRQVTPARAISIKEYVTGVYFQDWITFSDRFKVLLGGRLDIFSGTYDLNRNPIGTPPDTFSDTKTDFSYRVAVSYQPVKDFLTTYASVSSFFKPTRSQDTRTGKLFIPESGYQIEGGVKLEETDKLNVTLSGFYIKKNDLIIGHNSRSQVESATSTGIELDADAQPVKGLYLKLGYAYTNAYFDKYTPDPGTTDLSKNKTPWTPEHQINSWINYEFDNYFKGLGVGFGVNYVGKAYQNPSNTQSLPAYTVMNGTLYYNATSNVRIGLNIENLADELYFDNSLSEDDLYYYDPAYASEQATHQIYPGRGRNFKLSVSYNF
ncbi:TonB-dependent receptor [Oceanihabitans sp. IOP_32]|uniref:TonB-dependent receptor n=1 Tax=Oceanihabitans sp. IOP_32 TaxID=2529032 RepID=UPI001293BDC1|nr:TonB-dependent receptor [Oceanihabitans sp. IOP_32]QFZ54750.1 TonB-dependent receptor [Oceanihabitans sp. IOP_32]